MIELLLIVVIIGILSVYAMPKFIDISAQSEEKAERAVVGSIKTGIELYRAENLAATGEHVYPDELDDADTGQSSPDNPFFTNVMHTPYKKDKWRKFGNNQYEGPAGNRYRYDPSDGSFEKYE